MKKRRVLGLLLACVVIAVVGAMVWPGERGPEYKGKTLSEWLTQYLGAVAQTGQGVAREEAEHAVHEIGTNAVPWLLRGIRSLPLGWRARVRIAVYKYSRGWIKGSSLRWLGGDEPAIWDRAAPVTGFSILGAEASAAIPELERLACDTGNGIVAEHCALALCSLGNEALPALVRVTAKGKGNSRTVALRAVARAKVLYGIPALVDATRDSDPFVHWAAIYALRDIVPELVSALKHSDENVRLAAAEALLKVAPIALQEERAKEKRQED